MKKKRKSKKKNNNILILIPIILIVVFLIIFGIIENQSSSELNKALKQEGYSTGTNEDAFYKKIVTNNTLDDYYNDIAGNRESKYEEYYFAKESYDFIEVKLTYKDGVSTSLNITSNLRTKEVKYNYELAYKNAYLILEGDSSDDYTCRSVVKDNVSKESMDTYCNMIAEEINIFLKRREDVLNNQKIQEILNEPIKTVEE